MSGVEHEWDVVIQNFYSQPNELILGSVPQLNEWIANARKSFDAEPKQPFILPCILDGETYYYAVAPNRDQARVLRGYLTASIGPPLSDFDGATLARRPGNPALDDLVLQLAGQNASLCYFLSVARSERASCRDALQGLIERLLIAPRRPLALNSPIGRILGQFHDACSSLRQRQAEQVLDQIRNDFRVKATDQLFLEIEYLSSFEDWSSLKKLVDSTEILRLTRPSLVSDALARFAMQVLEQEPESKGFNSIASQFGALVPTSAAIRSQSGADYYGLWAIECGENPSEVIKRLRSGGWSTNRVDDFAVPDEGTPKHEQVLSTDQVKTLVRTAISQGRLDAAVSALDNTEPASELFEFVLDLVVQTPTAASIDLLRRYRQAISLTADQATNGQSPDSQVGSVTSAFNSIGSSDCTYEEKEQIRGWIDEHGVGDALRPGQLGALVETLKSSLSGADTWTLNYTIDTGLDLATAIKATGVFPDSFAKFGMALLEMWAYSDSSIDRARMERMIDLTFDILRRGLSEEEFVEVVEFLRSCWDPFLTDHDAVVGIEVVENLLSFTPGGPGLVSPFALPVLSRIGPHNAHRLGANLLNVASSLAKECSLEIQEMPWSETAKDFPNRKKQTVLIYSLLSRSSERAAEILSEKHPYLTIVTNDDHVATNRLRQNVRSANIVVITDRAAKHAATDAIRVEVGDRRLTYAMGRGSSSIIDAVEAELTDTSEGIEQWSIEPN